MKLSVALALSAAIVAVPAAANTVVIWPIDPVIKTGEQATSLWVENRGTEPVTLQVRSFGWSQETGEDVLSQQQEVVASPPIASVPAGGRQLVRVIRRQPQTDGAERAYRLFIDELPQPAAPGAGPQLKVQMRYSIPLFTYAGDAQPASPILSAEIRQVGAERAVLIRNTGRQHARLTDLRLEGKGYRTTIKAGLAGYVLAGQTLRVTLPSDAHGAVRAGVDGVDQLLSPQI